MTPMMVRTNQAPNNYALRIWHHPLSRLPPAAGFLPFSVAAQLQLVRIKQCRHPHQSTRPPCPEAHSVETKSAAANQRKSNRKATGTNNLGGCTPAQAGHGARFRGFWVAYSSRTTSNSGGCSSTWAPMRTLGSVSISQLWPFPPIWQDWPQAGPEPAALEDLFALFSIRATLPEGRKSAGIAKGCSQWLDNHQNNGLCRHSIESGFPSGSYLFLKIWVSFPCFIPACWISKVKIPQSVHTSPSYRFTSSLIKLVVQFFILHTAFTPDPVYLNLAVRADSRVRLSPESSNWYWGCALFRQLIQFFQVRFLDT